MFTHTPVDHIDFNGRRVFVKRDDLLHKDFSGNKARKFAYFLHHDFPGVSRLVGYGSPVANSLYSMSALAILKGWQLDFYTDHIAAQVLVSSKGNYAAAIENGANVIDLSLVADRDGRSCKEYIEQVVLPNDDKALYVPEGGRCLYARDGVHQLAREIVNWFESCQFDELTVFLPSGTGTTAVFLNEYFVLNKSCIKVKTCACVGGENYLKQQFSELISDTSFHPKILSSDKKYHFGKLYKAFYDIWRKVGEQGIEFELLYDPQGWICVEQHLLANPEPAILYIHQGGLLGNATMLPRYQRKYAAV
ncbi:1-aminocyclopropane-1-carboxylate deaminase/D-cysteine desulfhydrase [Shewanella sp. KX20019]|uniref:1-aminocyclopropane-1-carboxylate deaminase/D-cysteine desulfhydrase n=1 Tax=Shewanella sp. KX20019 TaxID=2803864 RepID=UPI001926335F|nr:1-aminocyclopropane-1-carboxylate deaminase/D-cysteine desulfhydrase [Shewanella sp. KX20019]QQX82137.1 1-aminocyclopropane-1-carboxylate deaminase/D-cysteine desulfhydrase [Shewanella sp. KX20019]